MQGRRPGAMMATSAGLAISAPSTTTRPSASAAPRPVAAMHSFPTAATREGVRTTDGDQASARSRRWRSPRIDYPILKAPMAGGTGTVDLVAAVSAAGGLGILGALMLSPDALRATIQPSVSGPIVPSAST